MLTTVESRKHYFRRIVTSTFVRNVAIIATGTAGAQAITISFAPIITRLYGPEAFGVLGIFMAIIAVFTPIAALAYPIAIVLPKEDTEAENIARLAFRIALVIAFGLVMILWVAGDWVVELLNLKNISGYILLIPAAMLFSAWLQIAEQWLIRKKQFKITARVSVIQAMLLNAAKTGVGLLNPVAAALIVLSVLSSAMHFFMIAIVSKNSNYSIKQKSQSKLGPSQWELAKKYYDFPLYRAPQIFINAISQSLPILMLAAFFGPASAGFYEVSRRVLGLPSQLISKSVGDVFYPRISEQANNGEKITRLILQTTLGIGVVGFVPFSLVFILGPWLFGFVFGAEWVIAGKYARWLALWTFFMFLNIPCIKTLPVLKAQGFHLVYSLFTIVIRLIVLAIGYYVFHSDLIAVALFGISGALTNILLISIIVLKSIKFDKSVFRRAVP